MLFFARNPDLSGEHVAFLKRPVIGQGHLVLFVTAQGQTVALLLGDALLRGHVLGGFHHSQAHVGIGIEVVHEPVLTDHLAAGAVGIGPDGVGTVGSPIRGEHEGVFNHAGFDTHGRLEDAGGAGGAGLADSDAGNAAAAHQGCRPGSTVELVQLADCVAEDQVVEDARFPALVGHPAGGGLGAQYNGVLVGHGPLPTAEGSGVVTLVGDERFAQHVDNLLVNLVSAWKRHLYAQLFVFGFLKSST
jgi:hypothetical protein